MSRITRNSTSFGTNVAIEVRASCMGRSSWWGGRRVHREAKQATGRAEHVPGQTTVGRQYPQADAVKKWLRATRGAPFTATSARHAAMAVTGQGREGRRTSRTCQRWSMRRDHKGVPRAGTVPPDSNGPRRWPPWASRCSWAGPRGSTYSPSTPGAGPGPAGSGPAALGTSWQRALSRV